MELLEAVGYDMELAGAELLGRDVAQLCSPPALAVVRSVFDSEETSERLVNHMIRTSTVAETAPFVQQMLTRFRDGLSR